MLLLKAFLSPLYTYYMIKVPTEKELGYFAI